jgi:hypothetical protein
LELMKQYREPSAPSAAPAGTPAVGASTSGGAATSGGAPGDPRVHAFSSFALSLNEAQREALETTLTVRQFVAFLGGMEQAAEGKLVDLAPIVAMLASLSEAQLARLGEVLTAEQLAYVATVGGAAVPSPSPNGGAAVSPPSA